MATTVLQLIGEIRGDLHEYTQEVFRNEDLLTWINDGLQAVVSETHGIAADWLTRRMKSTDGSETIQGATYNPSSLLITGGTDLYTLPPNVIQIRSLEPLATADRESGLVFLPRSHSDPDVLRAARLTALDTQLVYFYIPTGTASLRIVPTPASGVSISTELWYVAFPERLTMAGTVSAVPLQALKSIKAYATWLALQSINSPEVTTKYNVYIAMLKEFKSMLSPRQTNDPVFVEGVFDEEDFTCSY